MSFNAVKVRLESSILVKLFIPFMYDKHLNDHLLTIKKQLKKLRFVKS